MDVKLNKKKAKRGIKKEYNNNFEETYETYRRAFTVKKGGVDTKKPKSMKFKKMIKKKPFRHNK